MNNILDIIEKIQAQNKLTEYVIDLMYEYQRINEITKCCITNVQILYDIMKSIGVNLNLKIVSVVVRAVDNELGEYHLIDGHLCVSLSEDMLFDPSYEIFKMKNVEYFQNISIYLKSLGENSRNLINNNFNIREIIGTNNRFIQLAEQMNQGKFLINDRALYNAQLDYIYDGLRKKGFEVFEIK